MRERVAYRFVCLHKHAIRIGITAPIIGGQCRADLLDGGSFPGLKVVREPSVYSMLDNATRTVALGQRKPLLNAFQLGRCTPLHRAHQDDATYAFRMVGRETLGNDAAHRKSNQHERR